MSNPYKHLVFEGHNVTFSMEGVTAAGTDHSMYTVNVTQSFDNMFADASPHTTQMTVGEAENYMDRLIRWGYVSYM